MKKILKQLRKEGIINYKDTALDIRLCFFNMILLLVKEGADDVPQLN